MSQLIVGMLLFVVLTSMFEHYTEKRRCAYCGEVGRHKQDCPVDFDQRC